MGICDEEIVKRLKAKDKSMFEDIYKMYKNLVFYIINQYSVPSSDIDDVLQEIFMKVYTGIDNYNDGYASFKTWLVVVARNYILDYFKTRKPIIYDNEYIYNCVDQSTIEKASKFTLLEERLDTMEVDFLTLKIGFNFSHEELSQIYQISIDRCKKYFKKAKTKAINEWEKYENEIQ